MNDRRIGVTYENGSQAVSLSVCTPGLLDTKSALAIQHPIIKE